MNTSKNVATRYSPASSWTSSLADVRADQLTLLRLAAKQAVVTPAGVEEFSDYAFPFYSSAKALQLLSWSLPLPRGAQNLPERGELRGAQALCSYPGSNQPQLHWFQPTPVEQPNASLVVVSFRGFSQLDFQATSTSPSTRPSTRQAWVFGEQLTERARTTALVFLPTGGTFNFAEHRFFGESWYQLVDHSTESSSACSPTDSKTTTQKLELTEYPAVRLLAA